MRNIAYQLHLDRQHVKDYLDGLEARLQMSGDDENAAIVSMFMEDLAKIKTD